VCFTDIGKLNLVKIGNVDLFLVLSKSLPQNRGLRQKS
jgi:hypothetical protein